MKAFLIVILLYTILLSVAIYQLLRLTGLMCDLCFVCVCMCLCGGGGWDMCVSVENETVGDAVSRRVEQESTAPPSTHNGSIQEAEHTIVYPSRLIYYMNEKSESTYHNLNTQAKIPGEQGQVSVCIIVSVKIIDANLIKAHFGISVLALLRILRYEILGSRY